MGRLKIFGISFIVVAFLLPPIIYIGPQLIRSLSHYGYTRGYRYGTDADLYVKFAEACLTSIFFLVGGGYLLYLHTKQEKLEANSQSDLDIVTR